MEWLQLVDVDLITKLGISAVLGLVIGLERELKRKPLGLKTSLVISIISCLLTIVSVESAYTFPGSDDVRIQMDPLRLAAQIVSGIGFLGAGVILRRGNERISGLTTAALIWGAAGIGIAVGAGFYVEATFGVLLLLISVELLPYMVSRFGPKRLKKRDLTLRITVNQPESMEMVIGELIKQRFTISQTRIKDLQVEEQQLLEIKTKVNIKHSLPQIYFIIKNIEHVQNVEIIS
ncbi:MgtC/SapB family protein [Sporosarcina sp. Sa2YVA2]|uniref:MgtC/SapB family protein n=1 Tax=Sporosarcina quadrami TaxID=2762234 RepID=A0ABR8U8Y9_9BACL|nr:MgtC/SapB family protein [Sporosarcina quadrami]MBD7984502.1 MgtC/SapB family protein [Sporosarcina quadrami]